MRNIKMWKRMVSFLCMCSFIFCCSIDIKAQEVNITSYEYILEDENVDCLTIVKTSEEISMNPRISSKTITNVYTILANNGTEVVAKIKSVVSFNYSIPTTSGHIAQIYSNTISVIEVNYDSQYKVIASNIMQSKTSGDPAILEITVPVYYRSTGTQHGTMYINEYFNADGSIGKR